MKAGSFLKLFASKRSFGTVVMHFYDRRSKRSTSSYLTRYEVENIEKMAFAFKEYKVESFDIVYDEMFKHPVLNIYTSFESEE